MTEDGTNTYQWDAEGRLTQVVNGAGTAISTNTYNALGQRVQDVTQSNTTYEAYGADGALLWRSTGNVDDPNQRALVPLPGNTLAEYYGTTTSSSSNGMAFDFADALGSLGASVLYSGHGNPCSDRLFYPFGEFWTGVGNCGWVLTGTNTPTGNMHQTFAQLPDYDAETDQYNTANRHYSGNIGRWMSPDPSGLEAADPSDPQTWNMYGYVRNNPTTNVDPTGEYYCSAPDNNGEMNCVLNQDYWANPGAYPGYTYYKSNDPNDQDMPNSPQPQPDLLPASDPFDWYAAVTGVSSLVNGGYALAEWGIEDWMANRASIMTLGLVTGDEAADMLTAMGRPAWAKTPGGFVSWLTENFEKTKKPLTAKQADAVAEECKRLKIDIRLDPPQGAWNTPHFNVGTQEIHVAIPPSYDNPSVPKGRGW